jgi:oligopeptide transport system substrate-binding protein
LKNLRMRSRGALIAGIMLIALALVLAACGKSSNQGSSSSTSAGTPKPGGTYSFVLQAEPVNIEPLNAQESEGVQVAHEIFWGLVRYQEQPDGSVGIVPCGALSWTSNSTATVWTFKLNPAVKFGPPVNRGVTAADYVYGWNRATTPANSSVVSYILSPIVGSDDSGYAKNGLTGVTALDKYTLQVKLRYPFAEFPITLGHTVAAPVPKEYIEAHGKTAAAQNQYFDEHPVGDGPYMLQSWVHNQKIVLVKNPTFWDPKNAGYVDTINMPIYLNYNTEWLDFQKGVVDYSMVPPGDVAAAQSAADKNPSLAVYFIGINQKSPVVGGAKNLPLRQALYYSANAQAIINVINEGVDLPATGYIPLGIPGYLPNQSPYNYDVAKAQALMKTIGTVPTLSYWFNTDPGHQKIGEALQAGWQAIGVKMNLTNYAWATFLSKLQSASQELFRMGWIADYPSMDNFLFPLFQSQQARTGSYTFYNNPKFDALLAQARSTLDATQRHALYAQAEKMALTDIPAIPLYYYRDFRVTNNRIGGFQFNALGLCDMWKLWVK